MTSNNKPELSALFKRPAVEVGASVIDAEQYTEFDTPNSTYFMVTYRLL